jgi:maleylacetoacetate isomerase
MGIELYGFWRSLATFRVRAALNLKGLPYDEISIDLLKGEQYADSFRAVNPNMAVPALVIDGAPPLTQSLAIIEYLDETHPAPPLLPADARERALVRSLAQAVAADAHPLIVPRVRNYLTDTLGLSEDTKTAWIRHWSLTALAALEARLAPIGARFCVGDTPTVADLCLASHVVGARLFGFAIDAYPHCVRIADQCLAVDAIGRAHPLRQPGAPATPH